MATRRAQSVCRLAVLLLLMTGVAYAVGSDTLRAIQATVANIRMSESSNARAEAAERLVQLTKQINPADVDDKTLADLVSLLDSSDESVRGWIARCLGELGPRAKVAVPTLVKIVKQGDCVPVLGGVPSSEVARGALKLIGETPPVETCGAGIDPLEWNRWIAETVTDVRTSKFPGVRAMSAQQLDYLTFWIVPGKIETKNIAAIAALLDVPNEPVQNAVARALGHIGARAGVAVPRLEARLIELDCHPGSESSARTIRTALRKIGVAKVSTPNCRE